MTAKLPVRAVSLAHALDRRPDAGDFAPIVLPEPVPPPGGITVEVAHVSLDPYVGARLRGRHMGEPAPRAGLDPVPGAVVGRVIASDDPETPVGAHVHSMEGGWAERIALARGHYRRLPERSVLDVPLRAHLGALGMPGLTAWAGITRLAEVGAGDVVLVDAAAGAVGGVAGQLARARGAARVVGIAGGAEKCRLVRERYGFDAAVDYRAEDWRDALKATLPDGLSVFFENVSAEMAMIALGHARPYARGVLCGLVDAYHAPTPSGHALNAGMIIGKRARLSGLVVYDFYDRWPLFLAEVGPLVAAGRIVLAEDVAHGLDAAPALFERLMTGANHGKAVVTLIEDAP